MIYYKVMVDTGRKDSNGDAIIEPLKIGNKSEWKQKHRAESYAKQYELFNGREAKVEIV